jgi:biopolymer transport protein ExbB
LIGEPEQKVAILEEPSQALVFEEEEMSTDLKQPTEVVLVPLTREAKEAPIQAVAQESLQTIQDAIPQMEERAISSPETTTRIISAADRVSAPPFPEIQEPAATLDMETSSAEKKNEPVQIDIQHAFAGSPIIYTILLGMSIFAFTVWLYSLLSLRKTGRVSLSFVQEVKNRLNSNNFDGALSLCTQQENLVSKMVATGINARRHGLSVMIENMKIEGKRASIHFWQRIGLLNDIAVIAPMIGLLGTVLGMFYAFYDINRSIESISTLFDGLGISVGTTVAGLAVAILALILHSLAKYQLVKVLTIVENEAQLLATVIDDRSAEYQKR